MTYSIKHISDEKDLLLLFPILFSEAKDLGLNEDTLDREKMLENLYACFLRGVIFLGVKEETQEICGILALYPSTPWYSNEVKLNNLVYYVHQDHRKSPLGIALLREAKNYSIMKQLPLDIVVESVDDLDRKNKLFKLYGFSHTGGAYSFKP